MTPSPGAVTGRGAVLYGRARSASAAAGGVLALTALSWLLAPRQGATPALLLGAPAGAAVFLAVTLFGADADLDRTTPRLSPPLRAAHAVVATAVTATALTLAAWSSGDSAVLLRNAAALLGLVLLATVLGPPALSWVPAVLVSAVTWMAVATLPTLPEAGSGWHLLTGGALLIQPGAAVPAALTAAALLGIGTLAYALRGPAPILRDRSIPG